MVYRYEYPGIIGQYYCRYEGPSARSCHDGCRTAVLAVPGVRTNHCRTPDISPICCARCPIVRRSSFSCFSGDCSGRHHMLSILHTPIVAMEFAARPRRYRRACDDARNSRVEIGYGGLVFLVRNGGVGCTPYRLLLMLAVDIASWRHDGWPPAGAILRFMRCKARTTTCLPRRLLAVQRRIMLPIFKTTHKMLSGCHTSHVNIRLRFLLAPTNLFQKCPHPPRNAHVSRTRNATNRAGRTERCNRVALDNAPASASLEPPRLRRQRTELGKHW